MNQSYQLIDSGAGQKLERFGGVSLIRPCLQAVWRPMHPEEWKQADGSFSRNQENRWEWRKKPPSFWIIEIGGVQFKVAPTEFGHLGVFPEHAALWTRVRSLVQKGDRILNLFAYSGGVSLAAAQAGARVCHVDASKGMVDWARENAALNRLETAPIRWIVDDVIKFLKREARRDSKYEGIILDPPTFGRGSKGEVFKIESDLMPLLEACKEILATGRKFIILSCHTPGFTPIVLGQVMKQLFKEPVHTGELMIQSQDAYAIPSGCYAIYEH